MDMGILVEVAGRKMQEDFEPVLERQIHYFVNGASGIQHIGQRDIAWIRISKAAADKGFDLKHFGEILYARLHRRLWGHRRQGPGQDHHRSGPPRRVACQRAQCVRLSQQAPGRYDRRGGEEFYSCTLCQSFAPNHVCVVSPERLGLCGAYNLARLQASHQINPTGPNQPSQGPRHRPWIGTFDKINDL